MLSRDFTRESSLRFFCSVGLFLSAAFLVTESLIAQSVGPPFQVSASGHAPDVAIANDGSFVVVWMDDGEIHAQRYDSAGDAVGTSFQVNTYIAFTQTDPAVAIDGDGDFIIVWRGGGSPETDESGESVHGRRYDSAGLPLGGEFQVNTYTTGRQDEPDVAAASDGSFMIVWQSAGSGGSDLDDCINAQLYDSTGTAVGGELLVNSYTTGDQRAPAVTVDTAGTFTVVWADRGRSYVSGQRFDSAGSPVGSELQVADNQDYLGAVAVDTIRQASKMLSPAEPLVTAPEFVVSWRVGSDYAGPDVYAQRMDPSGTTSGSQLDVATTGRMERHPGAGMSPDGFVVVWETAVSTGSYASYAGDSIHGRRYAADGTALTGDFIVNTNPLGWDDYNWHEDPAVDADLSGSFIVVWEDTMTVLGRRFAASGIGDRVWNDDNKDGIHDGAEDGVEGIQVSLLDDLGALVDSTETDVIGGYSFTGIAPGDYFLRFTAPEGQVFTLPDQDPEDLLDSDVDQLTGETAVFTYLEGDVNLSIDAGLVPMATIGNQVWLDAGGEGVHNIGEATVQNVVVRLRDGSGTFLDSTATDLNGLYTFTPGSGDYILEFVAPPGYTFTAQHAGTDPSKDSDADPLTGSTPVITLAISEQNWRIDAGLVQNPVLGDRVWQDLDDDGVQDPGEPGVRGVTVQLLDDTDTVIDTTETIVGGFFAFEGLATGSYRLEYVLPSGYSFSTKQDRGSNDERDSDVDPSTGTTPLIPYTVGDADRSWDAGTSLDPSIFADGFESGNVSAWS